MLDIINEALRNQNYYICLYDKHLYIYNYKEILSFNLDLIVIKVNDIIIKVRGTNMHIKKMEARELLIIGFINGVYYE